MRRLARAVVARQFELYPMRMRRLDYISLQDQDLIKRLIQF